MASHASTTSSPQPTIEPDSTQAVRGTNIAAINRSRSGTGRFVTYGGAVGTQK
ncbi:hypothetical protein [Nocardioides zeae]